MNVEISKAQKEQIASKINMCVSFLKDEVQPHLTSKDNICINMCEELDLHITNKDLYVKHIRWVNLGIDFSISKTLYLEKSDRKKAKMYICEAFPEMAIKFLEYWEKAKNQLLKEIAEKNEEIKKIDNFIDSFRL